MATPLTVEAPFSRSRSGTGVPNTVAAMLVFIAVEMMFFAGLVSAYVISRAGAASWPPPGQPRLPLAVTAANTAVLLLSGIALYSAFRAWRRSDAEGGVARLLGVTIALGAAFLLCQGYEWARLIGFGLTMVSSAYGSFFYLIVGAHALHVAGAIAALVWGRSLLLRGELADGTLQALSLFWYFVVGLWPLLYGIVYWS